MNVSVIVPMYNSQTTLEACLDALCASEYPDCEIIVVDDSSTDASLEIARKYPVSLVELEGGPGGPARARNRGVQIAQGELLLFLDSDVLVYPDTISRIVQAFQADPAIAAAFGSYDENPSHRDFLSQYKNLIHYFTHQDGVEQAETFWCGCGAVKREVFQVIGGFDAGRYPAPSIEDIEFGYRLRASGYSIRLLKDVQVKHLKQWSLKSLIKTDIFNRAVPWTHLILRQRNLPNSLNLNMTQRLATFVLLLLLLHLALFIFQPNLLVLPFLTVLFMCSAASWHWVDGAPQLELNESLERTIYAVIAVIVLLSLWNGQSYLITAFVVFLPLFLLAQLLVNAHKAVRYLLYFSITILFAIEFFILLASYPLLLTIPLLIYLSVIILLNQRFYRFLLQKRGILFAVAAVPMQLLYYFYSFATFAIVTLIHTWSARIHRKQVS